MLFASDRDPLPPGQSYPLKAQAMDAALREAGNGLVRRVKWLRSLEPNEFTPVGSGILAEYDGIEPKPRRTHAHDAGMVTIMVYSVPGSERAETEAVLRDEGLPALVSWLAAIPERPETWRSEHHRFAVFLRDGSLEQWED
jgi:hypothetical protein